MAASRPHHPLASSLGLALALAQALALGLAPSRCDAGKNAPPRVPLFVLGDSQLDAGTNNHISTNITANFAPYGITQFRRSGRFSDGKIIPDYLADYMGIPYPKPFLSSPKPASTKYGLNFASAGAGILNNTSLNRTIPLFKQLEQFLGVVASKTYTPEALASSVVLISVGANDLFAAPTSSAAALQAYVGQLVTKYATFLQILYAVGLRNFVHVTIGPVGCTPWIRAPTNSSACIEQVNNLTTAVNGALVRTILDPKFFAPPKGKQGPKLLVYNQYAHALDIFKNVKKNGFSSFNACCGAPKPINGLVGCGRAKTINGVLVKATVCKDPKKVVFWDALHPGSAANGKMAASLWTGGDFSLPKGLGAQTLLPK